MKNLIFYLKSGWVIVGLLFIISTFGLTTEGRVFRSRWDSSLQYQEPASAGKKTGLIVTSKKDINRRNVHPHLKKHISPESDLYTDQSKVYIGVKNIFPTHKIVNHSKKSYVQNNIHINGVENAWKHLKKTIDGTYFHLSRWHFDRYLGETTYRWNRRKEPRRVLIEDFMSLVLGKGITYDKLKKNNPKWLAA